MKKEYKDRWVEALRSGKYKQAKGTLRNKEGFCCLGVLCDIVKDELGYYWSIEEEASHYTIFNSVGVLPFEVMELVGMAYSDGSIYVEGDEQINHLPTYNDQAGEDFNQIADRILS